MIICYMGTPGAGKSYEAAIRILENLKRGRHVYAHLEGIQLKECQEIIRVYSDLYGDLEDKLTYVPFDQLPTFFKDVEPGSFIVIDEIHKFVSNRDWQTQKNKDFADWCSTHRHIGCDVLIITQHLDKVDSHIRTLVEWTYRFRKINFFGSLVQNRYIEYVYPQDDVTGEALSHKTKTYNKKMFPMYKSYAGKDIKELKVVKSTNLFKHPVFYGLAAIFVVFVVLLFRSPMIHGDLFGIKKQSKTIVQAKNVDGGKGGISYLGGGTPLVKEIEPKKEEKPVLPVVKVSDPLTVDAEKVTNGSENFTSGIPAGHTRKLLKLTKMKLEPGDQKGVIYVGCADNECLVRQ